MKDKTPPADPVVLSGYGHVREPAPIHPAKRLSEAETLDELLNALSLMTGGNTATEEDEQDSRLQ